jgi:TatD DNase family protein
MNAICEHSLYNICSCKKKYHLPLNLPLYDGHCHVDLFFKYGLNYDDFNMQHAHGRKMIYIDNRHQHHRWFGNYVIKNDNAKIFTTYGIRPKYIPSDPSSVLKQLEDIFKNKFQLNTTTVAIGECGIDETSNCSNDSQLYIFKSQLKLASELKLPLVLHARGFPSFEIIFRELQFHLNNDHNIHWHCINPRSNLNVISNFLHHFNNSFIGLNGSMITSTDNDNQKHFNNWLVTQDNVIDRIILETDYPFLRPSTLEPNQYTPISGITISAQHIVNILRMKNLNITKIIDRSNNNVRRMYRID